MNVCLVPLLARITSALLALPFSIEAWRGCCGDVFLRWIVSPRQDENPPKVVPLDPTAEILLQKLSFTPSWEVQLSHPFAHFDPTRRQAVQVESTAVTDRIGFYA